MSEAVAVANQALIIAAGLEVSEMSPQSKIKAAAGAVATGSIISATTVIVAVAVPRLPHSSSAVQVTVITPPAQTSIGVTSKSCMIVI